MMEDNLLKQKQEASIPMQFLGGEEVHADLALQLGIPVYKELPPCQLPKEIYKKVPYAFVKKNFIIPVFEENGVITVAVADPLDLEPLEELPVMPCDESEFWSVDHDNRCRNVALAVGEPGAVYLCADVRCRRFCGWRSPGST